MPTFCKNSGTAKSQDAHLRIPFPIMRLARRAAEKSDFCFHLGEITVTVGSPGDLPEAPDVLAPRASFSSRLLPAHWWSSWPRSSLPALRRGAILTTPAPCDSILAPLIFSASQLAPALDLFLFHSTSLCRSSLHNLSTPRTTVFLLTHTFYTMFLTNDILKRISCTVECS